MFHQLVVRRCTLSRLRQLISESLLRATVAGLLAKSTRLMLAWIYRMALIYQRRLMVFCVLELQ